MVQSNKKDFSGQNISIGIDVHLRTWSVTVLTPSGFMRTHTQKASAKELFEHLNKHYPNGSYRIDWLIFPGADKSEDAVNLDEMLSELVKAHWEKVTMFASD
ncbi:hypothetical protein [Paramuribaculum intestinale]|uniref:hypothetical protein n=1 Tax=Paramuribaculum intestinale TaxID=2094151 RepID=UPI0025B6BAB1|nr:hypothetical protein [Paramuribaculum intestinale]